jgi:hypothetical protein
VTYPGDENLAVNTYGAEPMALVKEFSGKTDWRQLDAKFLDRAPDGWGSALLFFSERALQFYLPAYMIADIRGDLTSSNPAGRLCSSLSPAVEKKKIAKIFGGGTAGEHARAEFARYDARQVSALLVTFWRKLESDGGHDPDVEQAMEAYWLIRDAGG